MPTSPVRFINFLKKFHSVSPGLELFLQQHIRSVRLPRSTRILEKGKKIENLYFVTRGLVRGYVSQGKEDVTTWLVSDETLLYAIANMSESSKSLHHIDTIKTTNLIILPLPAMKEAYEKYPEFNLIMRLILQNYYAESDCRSLIARIPNGKLRYGFFKESFPHLNDRVPLKYIASFIGIKQETLSRIRKDSAQQE